LILGPPNQLKTKDLTKSSAVAYWQAPESDRGSPVTGYYVEKCVKGTWSKVNKKAITALELLIEELVEKQKYEIRVSAENLAGIGKPCAAFGFVAKSEFDVPGKPGQPEVAVINTDNAEITWAAPSTDGRSPITNYVVEMRKKGDAKYKVVNSTGELVVETKYTVKGLLQGTEYEFRVTAENKVGPGEPSAPSKPAKYCKRTKNLVYYRFYIKSRLLNVLRHFFG